MSHPCLRPAADRSLRQAALTTCASAARSLRSKQLIDDFGDLSQQADRRPWRHDLLILNLRMRRLVAKRSKGVPAVLVRFRNELTVHEEPYILVEGSSLWR